LGVVIAEWLVLLMGVGGGSCCGSCCCCCGGGGGGGDSGQLVIGCGGGLELLRTLVCELELDEVCDEHCDDEEEEDEDEVEAAAPDTLAADAVDMVVAVVEPATT